MLTGDRRLRTRAEEKGVFVKGVLFVLDQLVSHDILPKAFAAEKLELLRQINKRLPVQDVENRLQEWTEVININDRHGE